MPPLADQEAEILSALAQVLNCDIQHLSPSKRFDEVGLDSLKGLRMAALMERRTNKPFEVEWLYDHPSASLLASFLNTQS